MLTLLEGIAIRVRHMVWFVSLLTVVVFRGGGYIFAMVESYKMDIVVTAVVL